MVMYRAFIHESPNSLLKFKIKNSEHYTLGSGMYFYLTYEFAKIFALNNSRNNISFIGKYDNEIPLNIDEISLEEADKRKHLGLNNYSTIIKDREIVFKEHVNLNLISFDQLLNIPIYCLPLIIDFYNDYYK